MRDVRDYNLARNNTFGIRATCRRFVEPETAQELREFLSAISDADRPLLIIGGGSNLLLTADYPATVLHPCIKGIEVVEDCADHVVVRAGCAEEWDSLVALTVGNGWQGAENLSLIPGEVGATAVQNIGAYGAEVKDIICSVEAIDVETLEQVCLQPDDCAYGYRYSRFKDEWKGRYVITHVSYRLSKSSRPNLDYGRLRPLLEAQGIYEPTLQDVRDAVVAIRREKLPDPAVEGNAGSFFINPTVGRERMEELLHTYPGMPHYPIEQGIERVPAGWLIEQCGWKGRTLAKAGVHGKQALVIVNKGGASGQEILNLARAIMADVEKKFGILLRPEVNIV